MNRSFDAASSGGKAISGAAQYRPYPAYKDSGVDWLGEIPARWEVKKATRLFSIGSGTTPPTEDPKYYDGGIPWITTSELREAAVTSTEKTITQEALRAFPTLNVYPKGSIAVAMYGATIGRLGILGVPAAVNQACCVFSSPNGMYPWFWFYWLQSRRRYLISLGYGGGQPNLSQELLKSLRVPAPSFPEQRAIAAFLDRETGKIDALVANKERLIELLQEKRTALISHAVTKGLDPDVPLKDSGVEWLGQIPAHWEVQPIRSLARPGYKTFTDGDWIESPYIRDEGVRLIQTGNIGTGTYREQGFRYIDIHTFHAFQCTEVVPGDVLICRLADPVGRACLAPDLGCRMITSVDVCILKTAEDIDPAFLVYALSADNYLGWLSGICRGGTRDRVSRSMLGAIRVWSHHSPNNAPSPPFSTAKPPRSTPSWPNSSRPSTASRNSAPPSFRLL